MNQKNVIKSLIPQRLLEYVPSAEREEWADRVVSWFKDNNPELYVAMGEWGDIPEEKVADVQNEIIAAVAAISTRDRT